MPQAIRFAAFYLSAALLTLSAATALQSAQSGAAHVRTAAAQFARPSIQTLSACANCLS
jgi:hypothetical protein